MGAEIESVGVEVVGVVFWVWFVGVWQWLVRVRGSAGCEIRVEGIIGWVRVWSMGVGG